MKTMLVSVTERTRDRPAQGDRRHERRYPQFVEAVLMAALGGTPDPYRGAPPDQGIRGWAVSISLVDYLASTFGYRRYRL
jgi:hypothetical protein